jgi:hypothetical protein
MTKTREQAVLEDVRNVVDACLYECLIDIPEALCGNGECNEMHTVILQTILDRIEQTHGNYYIEIDEEEDE